MLRINYLNMSAGNFSVNNISLSVPDGCCHVLLGGTGNGKTLILETIAGLRPITNGEIWTDEYNITNEPPEKRFISYVPQDLALFPHLTVEKNILYSKRFKKNHSRSNEEIREIIECMHLENILHRSVRYLSGGEQQRVALARAFVSGNKVLLLDEPFSALHFTMKRALWSLLLDIQKKYSLSILMVTHDLEEASFLGDYISVLHQGKTLQTGTKENVFRNPANIEVTKITGHYNYFSGEVVNIKGNHRLVYFDRLCAELMIKNTRFTPGDKLIMAIRASNIDIISYDSHKLYDSTNTVSCKIKNLYETTHYHQIILTPLQEDNTYHEIVVNIYDKRNIIKFEIGQNVTASFQDDSMLIFNPDGLKQS